MLSWWGVRRGRGSGGKGWRGRWWGGRGGNSLLRVRYTIVLLNSVIKKCVEDFIKHAIRVGIINEGLFEDIYVVDENFVGGRSFVSAVDHGADSGIFIPKGAFTIKVKINARVGGFDERLSDDMFMAVIYVDI